MSGRLGETGSPTSVETTEKTEPLPTGDSTETGAVFSKLTGATLYVDGQPTVLALDDPRLLRFLDFFGECVRSREVLWSQGWLDARWMESVESNKNRLEITFQNTKEVESTFDLYGYDRLIVCDRHVCGISFVDASQHNCYEKGKRAMAYWPDSDEFASKEEISLLEYIGFM